MTWLTLGLFSALNIYAALQMHFNWRPASVTYAKAAVAAWPVAGILVGIVIPQMILKDSVYSLDANDVNHTILSILLSAIWLVYLSKSKRVGATYLGERANVQTIRIPPKAQEETNVNAGTPTKALPEFGPPLHASETDEAMEEKMYDEIGIELESGSLHRATWLKAFAHANGDENLARATYIKLRIEKFRAEKTLVEST